MDTAWISAFSAVMGSLVGAFTSFVTTYANQRSQYKRDFLSKQFAKRETLYSEYKRPDMTAEEIRKGAYLDIEDPLKEFGEACRKELNNLYHRAV
jgi:hypothetical protein